MINQTFKDSLIHTNIEKLKRKLRKFSNNFITQNLLAQTQTIYINPYKEKENETLENIKITI